MTHFSLFPHRMGRSSRGQSFMEFGMTAPLILLVSLGILDFGRGFFTFANASNSLRNALRYGAIPGSSPAGVPQYTDCQGMIDISKEVLFDSDSPIVTVNYIDQHDETNILFTCSDGDPGNPTPTQIQLGTENGDIIHIVYDGEVQLLTPLFPETLQINLEGQRTLVKFITVQDPPYCGNDVCDLTIGETADTCGCDCGGVCFDGVVPTITFVSPSDGATISENQWLEITASDSETSSSQLQITFKIADSDPLTDDIVLCDPIPATAPPPPTEVGMTSTFRCLWDTSTLPDNTYRLIITAVDGHGNSITTNTTDYPALVLNTINLDTCGIDADSDGNLADAGETTANCFKDTGVISSLTVSSSTECNVNNQFRHIDLTWGSVSNVLKYRLYAQCANSLVCSPTFTWTPIFESAGTSCSGRDGNYRPYCYRLSGNATYVLWGSNSTSNFIQAIDYYVVALNANDVVGPRRYLQEPADPLLGDGKVWVDSGTGIGSHVCNNSGNPGVTP